MKAVDSFTPARAAGLAVVPAMADPKNLVPAVGGGASIAASDAATGGRAVAVVVMVLIASLCILAPLGVHLLGGARSAQILAEWNSWKSWMGRHSPAVMTTVLIVLGDQVRG